ncbi:hypothetical protein E2C01_052963 [Portunus trituberculatus]|uniref:Uncharacterized protein n=1 Tax=Portunus trituberculatus TaxID=210409 RepID=A0A5B7GF59_PORTR|nr:hypothetical protein [Portunus trituberculatus]
MLLPIFNTKTEQFLITYASYEGVGTVQPLPLPDRMPQRSASSSEEVDLEMDCYHMGTEEQDAGAQDARAGTSRTPQLWPRSYLC